MCRLISCHIFETWCVRWFKLRHDLVCRCRLTALSSPRCCRPHGAAKAAGHPWQARSSDLSICIRSIPSVDSLIHPINWTHFQLISHNINLSSQSKCRLSCRVHRSVCRSICPSICWFVCLLSFVIIYFNLICPTIFLYSIYPNPNLPM